MRRWSRGAHWRSEKSMISERRRGVCEGDVQETEVIDAVEVR